MTLSNRYPTGSAAERATEMRTKKSRVRLTSRLKVVCTVVLTGSSLLLTGCSGGEGMTAGDFASQVAATVEQNISVSPEVDCGTGSIELAAGATVECFITNPETRETFRADVEITNVSDDQQLELNLSVDPKAI